MLRKTIQWYFGIQAVFGVDGRPKLIDAAMTIRPMSLIAQCGPIAE
jgi:hypothetical protein